MRAQRYPLHLPVRYCCIGETQWHVGLTENISESGAVIRATEIAPPPHTRVMIAIALPSGEAMPGGWLVGEGVVVRSADSFSSTTNATFAVTTAALTIARPEDLPEFIMS